MLYVLCLLCLSVSITYTSTTDIYPLSLHDALPIFAAYRGPRALFPAEVLPATAAGSAVDLELEADPPQIRRRSRRSEEHTSELQSLRHLVCRLLLEKKKDR